MGQNKNYTPPTEGDNHNQLFFSSSITDALSTLPCLTAILIGKGDIPVADDISGTAARPRSEDEWFNIVMTDFVNIELRAASNFCRSATILRQC
jgi:hypothetical protein